ncbi:hypothetical protein P7E02_21855 [Enterococcus hulanensis]|uniref:hypothetical protein n=1 Tax=Enterococcus hulanensis TaxID=2559929 RepID=UPI00288F4290|nr:hypothetical protein [Enterococcus hulanensis]MDT2662544.1 hypothetical protein [Enterococcus hulanensis]
MESTKKFNSIVIGITTTLMFITWHLIQDFSEKHELIKNYSLLSSIITSALSFILSIGFYRLVFRLLSILFNKSKCFKKWILGKTYLEGIWIGCFVGATGKKRFFYEIFTQSLDGLMIRGYSFEEDFSPQSTWSVENAVINPHIYGLTYTYLNDSNASTHTNLGLANFTFILNKKEKAKELKGYTCDLFNTKKIYSIEKKYSDNVTIEEKENILIEEARKMYLDHEDRFRNINE